MIYKTIMQRCSKCGHEFWVQYCSDGTYNYIDEPCPCECESEFHAVDGPSMGEWLDQIRDFLAKYDICFDAENNVRLCGRDACKELIHAASVLDMSQNFGDPETGFMHIPSMVQLRDLIGQFEISKDSDFA